MKGLSLLEIIIVIGILALLAALGTGSLLQFSKTTDLNSSVEGSVSLLLEARSKTLSSQEESQYGVHFESDKIVLFKGAAYSSSDPLNEETVLPLPIETASISLNGGGSDVIFKRLTGETDQYGTVTFRLKSDTSRTRILIILATGVVSTTP